MALPERESHYLLRLVDLLRESMGDQLVAAYLFGSGAYGDYEAGPSDLDVQALVDGVLDPACRDGLIERLDHTVFPCPARRLEFVCYAARDVAPPARHPRFQLNLNTGSDLARHVATDPAEEPSHWFLLDLAIGREFGQALYGPPPAELVTEVPRGWQLEAILDSLSWHGACEPATPNRVLNACRAWRYAESSCWGSKRQGARWVAARHPELTVVPAALAARPGHGSLDARAAHDLDARTRAAVRLALGAEAPPEKTALA